MKNYYRIFLILGSLFGLTGVALGAFGAHGLKSTLAPEMLLVFETAVRYQMYHAFALITVVLLQRFHTHRFNIIAGWFFIAGIALFSGSLYIFVLSELRWLGIVTPFGGVCFLLGWLMLFLSALKIKKES